MAGCAPGCLGEEACCPGGDDLAAAAAAKEAACAAPCLTAPAMPFAPSFCVVVPLGVVTVIMLASDGSIEHSILYPGGKNVLKPCMRDG